MVCLQLCSFFTGSALIASLQLQRNTVAVENNATQFLYSKLRVVSILSKTNEESDTADKSDATPVDVDLIEEA